MLHLLVSSQVHLALEAFSTQVTAERFKTSVLSAVRYQIGTLTESFAAYLTFVRLLSYETGGKKMSTFDLAPQTYSFHVRL